MDGTKKKLSSSVLLIQEPSSWRSQLEKLLRNANLKVHIAAKAQEALSMLDERQPPDIIVTDLLLPDMDGLRLGSLLHRDEYRPFNTVPILIISPHAADQGSGMGEHQIHANTYLIPRSKPEEMQESIRKLVQNKTLFQPRVLVVEDSTATSRIAKSTLETEGCLVDIAGSSKEALEAFSRHVYQTALLDYHLPDQNGDELLQKLQRQQPGCVFLMMTTNPDPSLASHLMQLGASGYLHKPFAPDYLRHLYWRAHRERRLMDMERLLMGTNQQLLANQEKLQAVLSALPDLVFQFNQSGDFLDYHANSMEDLYRHPEEFMGKNISDVFPAELSEPFLSCIQASLDTGTLQTYEYSLKLAEKERYFEARFTPCPQNVVLTMVRDITEQKLNRKVIEESEKRLHALANNAPGAVFQLTEQSDGSREVTYSTETIKHLLGWDHISDPQDLLSQFLESSHPEDLERLQKSIEKAITSRKPWEYEGRFIHPEQGTIWLKGLANPRESAGTLYFEGILFDVTRRKDSEKALKESELKFRTLVNQVVEMLFLHDLEGRILDVNEAAVKTTGYSRQELLSMNVTDLDLEAHTRDDAGKIWRELTPSSTPVTFEVHHKRKDGSTYPAEVTLSKVVLQKGEFIFALARDITERNRAEEALRRSEQKYRSLTTTTIDWVFQMDAQGQYTYVSPNVEDIMGYAVDEVLGRTPFDFMAPVEAEKTGAIFAQAIEKGSRLVALEDILLHKDGHPIYFETNAVPLLDAGGELLGFFGTCRDISARKQAENVLIQREEELRRAQEVAHVGSWQFDLNSGTVVTSEEARRIYGLGNEDVSISDVQQIPLPEYRPHLDQALTELIENDTAYDIQFRIRRPTDGTVRHIHSRAEYDSENNRVIGTIQDITERARAQEALRENEKLLRTIAENFPHAYLSIIEEDLTVGFTSGQEFRKQGLDPEAFEGLTLEEVFGEHTPAVRKHYLDTFNGTPSSFELQIGDQHQLYRTVPLEDEDGSITRILSVVEDITEQKQKALAREQLLLRQQRQAEVLAAAAASPFLVEGNIEAMARQVTKTCMEALDADWLGVWLFEDNQTRIRNIIHYDAASGKHSRKSDLYEQDLPWKFDLLKKSRHVNIDDILHGIEQGIDEDNYLSENHVESVLDAVIRSGGRALGTLSFETINRTHHWQEDEIEFACRLADQFALAISNRDRRAAEAERERLNQAIEQSGEMFLITDAEGNIQYVNPAFEDVTGYTRTEVLGENLRILNSGKHDRDFFEQMWSELAKGNTWEGQIINKKKDGSLYTESASISPVFNAAGEIVNHVAVKRDISEQLRLQREKELIEEQYRQTQRVEAVGRLAGGVAHDLNNLLTPILLHSEILLDTSHQDEDSRSALEEILKAGNRARDLVNQLLAFSRKQNLEYKPVDINAVVKDFSTLLRRTIREDILIDFSLGQVDEAIHADRGQIEQVIMNLAVNAQDAMPDGGHLILETGTIKFDEVYAQTHLDITPGRYAVLAVSDTGEGIDEETRKRMFEPFFSTKGKLGTGLGLATVYGIVKQHNGTILVYSEPGYGSTFKVFLPLHGEIQHRKQQPTPSRKAYSGDETILLVEDNHQVRSLTLSILQKQGYHVLDAQNGQQALEVLDSHQGDVHLLLTDVIMPRMNGRDLYNQALQRKSDLKVLYMSGYTNDVIADQGVLEDGITFIQKPFSVEKLTGKVREVLEQEHSQNTGDMPNGEES